MKDTIDLAITVFLSVLGIILGAGLGTLILIIIGFLIIN